MGHCVPCGLPLSGIEMTEKANDKQLSELHAELAKQLKAGIKKVDPETGLPNSALLSVARQFLKDNFITADAGAAKGPLQGLADLPEFSEDENVVRITKRI